MSAAAGAAQDLPPPGGFPETVRYQRYLPRRGPSGAVVILSVLGIMTYGWYKMGQANAEYKELRREKAWSRILLAPLLQAETDRDLVRRLEAVRAREEHIMRETHPDWSPLDLKAPIQGIGAGGVYDPSQAQPVYHTQRYVNPTYFFFPPATGKAATNDPALSNVSVIPAQWWRGSNMLFRNPQYHKRQDFTKEHPIGQ